MRTLAILTVRNEGAFLLEWLAHHRAVGVSDFLVFSNNCDDGTDTMLDHLAQHSWLTHVRNDGPFDKGGIQFTALKAAQRLDIVQDADWILPLDIDEFVNIHVGDHTLDALRSGGSAVARSLLAMNEGVADTYAAPGPPARSVREPWMFGSARRATTPAWTRYATP